MFYMAETSKPLRTIMSYLPSQMFDVAETMQQIREYGLICKTSKKFVPLSTKKVGREKYEEIRRLDALLEAMDRFMIAAKKLWSAFHFNGFQGLSHLVLVVMPL